MYRIPSGKGWLRDGVASRGARLYLCVMASYQPAIPSQLPRVLNTYSELFLRLGYPQVRTRDCQIPDTASHHATRRRRVYSQAEFQS